MNSPLPIAVRAIAAAFAVFMTTATLDWVISIAEPQQSQLMAQNAGRKPAQVAAPTPRAVIVAQASTSTAND